MKYFASGTILGIITCLVVELTKAQKEWKPKW